MSKRSRATRLHLTTADARKAAVSVGELLAEAGEVVLHRAVPGSIGARRPRGRGAALSAVEQLAVMYWAAVYFEKPKAIARALGMDRKTVQRVLRTPVYFKFREGVMLTALQRLCSRRL